MDRMQQFIEYSKILQEAEEWLSKGYRSHGEDKIPIILPEDIEDDLAKDVNIPGKTDALFSKKPTPEPVESFISRPDNQSEISLGESATLLDIAAKIRDCRQCNLNLTRDNTVPGIGLARSPLMVLTAAPVLGAKEGDSPLAPVEQEYLDKWLVALGLTLPRDVFITPAVKCRTPGKRPPVSAELEACKGYFSRQFKAVSPRAILALGASACAVLTGNPADFPALVGKEWNWEGIPALVLWPPSEVLANPVRLRKPVWEALKNLKALCNGVPGTGL